MSHGGFVFDDVLNSRNFTVLLALTVMASTIARLRPSGCALRLN